jgi:hypothetical protein
MRKSLAFSHHSSLITHHLFMIEPDGDSRRRDTRGGLAILASGVPVYFLWRRTK